MTQIKEMLFFICLMFYVSTLQSCTTRDLDDIYRQLESIERGIKKLDNN